MKIYYKDINGDNKQLERIAYGFDNAKALEYKLIHENKISIDLKNMTIEKLCYEYLKFKSYEIRETSLNKTHQILTNHILPSFHDIYLSNINTVLLQKWKMEIEEKKLSFAMRKSIYTAFSALLNYAVKLDYISQNPLLKVGNFKDPYHTKRKMDFYTPNDFLKFIEKAKLHAQSKNNVYEWNYYVFFNIAFFTGMRKGEIYALKWTDIENNIVHVQRSITQKLKDGDRETPPKNKSSYRSLQLPQPLIDVLNEHYMRYKTIDDFSDDWRICGGITPIRDTTLDLRNKEFAKSAGLKKIRLHDFRHSHTSLLANEGINIQEIARRLGHSNVQITWNTYSHLYPREEERAISVLNRIIQ